MLQREEPALCRQLESEVLYLNEDCALPGYRLAPRRAGRRHSPSGDPGAQQRLGPGLAKYK